MSSSIHPIRADSSRLRSDDFLGRFSHRNSIQTGSCTLVPLRHLARDLIFFYQRYCYDSHSKHELLFVIFFKLLFSEHCTPRLMIITLRQWCCSVVSQCNALHKTSRATHFRLFVNRGIKTSTSRVMAILFQFD